MTQSAVTVDNRQLLLDTFERAVVALLYCWLVYRFATTLSERPTNIAFVLGEGIVVCMVLFRRTTDQISVNPMDWVTGLAGFTLPLLLEPTSYGLKSGILWLLLGLAISVGAKLTLRRSFGVIAANRGIKRDGLYAGVRHPMYLGYLTSYIGVLMLNPSTWNATILAFWMAFQIARINAEEQILMRDPAYREHAELVRYRLIPFVY